MGQKYEKINNLLLRLSEKVNVNLWTLDALIWRVIQSDAGGSLTEDEVDSPTFFISQPRFGLERHLHEFLLDNWSYTDLSSQWNIYEEDGDPERGSEYPTSIGRIDILAKHKTEPHWLVIELKRNQSTDKTVGQIMRYMGWVKKELADPNDEVRGLIIAHQAEESLKYALEVAPKVDLHLYEVQFNLRSA